VADSDDQADVATAYGPEAGDTVYTQKTNDYLLDANNELVMDDQTEEPKLYLGDNKKASKAKAEVGDAYVARKGQAREGYVYANGAWTSVLLDNTDTESSDEAPNTYVAPSKNSMKVADLDKDTDEEVGYYKGGEQLFYLGTTDAGTAETVPSYGGGESVIAHAKGDVKLGEDGNPVVVGTGEVKVIKGDGLGVRRHFG
jgi:hypothetical protein